MKKPNNPKNNRQHAIVGLLFVVFVSGFYSIDSLYNLWNARPQKIILADNPVEHLLNEAKNNPDFSVEAVNKITNDFPVYDFRILDANRIVFHMPDSSYNPTQLAVLQFTDQQLTPLLYSSSFDIVPTLDSKRFIAFGKEQDYKKFRTYVYDAKSLKLLDTQDGFLVSPAFFADHEHYLGVLDNDLVQSTLGTGERTFLSNVNELEELLGGINGAPSSFFAFKKGHEANAIYFLTGFSEGASLIQFNASTLSAIGKPILAEAIHKFEVLKNGDLLIQGIVNGKQGLFLYDLAAGEYHPLQEGIISDFAITEDETKIAYVLINETKTLSDDPMGDLHVAYLGAYDLTSNVTLYQNLNLSQSLAWHQNMLFSIGNQMMKSEILRFSFKS